MNTKTRILDTAERLFAHHGIEATSLRTITAEAGVNLAAVNYHFQSKEALMHAVIARRLDPINQRRLAMLDQFEAEAGTAIPLNQLLDAMLRPIFEMLSGPAKEFAPMMSRIFTESSELTEKVFQKHMAHVLARFFPALERALPHLSQTELLWRMQFMMGAVAHTIGGAKVLQVLSGGLCDASDVEGILRRLESFLLAGLQAPAPVEVEHAVH
ncbi:MAG TPA: TetR/AcrR family transcriptional regulator [Bryobacteraceae bacterium]|nr:TetR/AcrR family transcriptional regulator [Bryobacteraceae bacterium]